jgi:hypothetical protein
MKKIVILMFAALVALPVFAQKPLRFVVSEDISYDDNIYLTAKDEKDSVISSTRVGAQYKNLVPGSGLLFSADGLVGYNAYTEKASKNNYWDALAGLDLSNDTFKVGDKFIYTSDPANNALTERAKRLQNNGYLSWQSSKEKTLGIGFNISDIYDYYIDKDWDSLNRNRFNAGAQLNYNVSHKTQIFAEYVFSDITYNTNKVNNSNGSTFGLGINGQIAPKVTGTAKATYAMRDYEHNKAGADNYADLAGYYLELEWKPTENDTLRLSGERSMEETTYGVNRYYVDTAISLYAAHRFFTKWTASVAFTYDNMAYPKAATAGADKRKDDMFSVRPELGYQFKDWLSAGVWYNFSTRRSTDGWAKYDRNRAGVFARALF